MAITNESGGAVTVANASSVSASSLSNDTFVGANRTWDETTSTYESVTGTWDKGYLAVISNEPIT